MINGMINVYKEKGFTSFDVCAKMRGICGQKKVGHTGTLDPNAEGVLPVCLGNATKLCDMLTDKRKEYIATFLLGKKTDTLDIWGEVLEEKEPTVSVEDLKASIMSFVGGYNQLPPMYSAKKINGQKLYDLARAGKEVERKASFVDIFDIEILSIDYPSVSIRVECGKGTYIRSLCADIAEKCGELACMTSLTRTRVSNFYIEDAVKLSDIERLRDEGRLSECVTDTETVFLEYKKASVKPDFRKLIDNGNKLFINMIDFDGKLIDNEMVRIYNDEGTFVGLFIYSATEDIVKPYKMFMER